jgi:nucleoside-diphosphate-sugar epimerase
MLMLGASGKLGRMLRAVWRDENGQGIEIIPVYRQSGQGEGAVWAPGQPVGDLPRVDVVLALWGVTRGDGDALRKNAVLAEQAMALGAALGANRVLHCSSAAVYRPGPDPLSESAPTVPPGAYGSAKLEMERAIFKRGAEGQVLMRIGNVAGAESLFHNMKPGGRITLDRFSDGSGPARSYVAPQLLARAVAALSLPDAPDGVVNVAAPRSTEMAAIARAANCDVAWRDAPATAIPLVALDTTRLQSICAMAAVEADARHLVSQALATGCWP